MMPRNPSFHTSVAPYASDRIQYNHSNGQLVIVLTLRGRGQSRKIRGLPIVCFSVGVKIPPTEARRRYARQYNRKRYTETYAQAQTIVANGEVRCALEDETCKGWLEIDHINNDGAKDRARYAPDRFYHNIVSGKRATDDLRILCRSHNQRGKWK